MSKFVPFLTGIRHRLSQLGNAIQQGLEHQSRLWVVTIREPGEASDTFVIDEGQFTGPLQWMVNKGYCEKMLNQVDTMPRSGVLEWDIGKKKHQLLRVK